MNFEDAVSRVRALVNEQDFEEARQLLKTVEALRAPYETPAQCLKIAELHARAGNAPGACIAFNIVQQWYDELGDCAGLAEAFLLEADLRLEIPDRFGCSAMPPLRLYRDAFDMAVGCDGAHVRTLVLRALEGMSKTESCEAVQETLAQIVAFMRDLEEVTDG